MPILKVDNLPISDSLGGRTLVHDLSCSLTPGTCLGLVGESGSGKSLTCRAIIGALTWPLEVSGQVIFEGRNILESGPAELSRLRGRRLGLIIQEAMSAFNPLYKIGRQMRETLELHLKVDPEKAEAICLSALERLEFREPAGVMNKYPHQLSGGMLQRVMIALTLALKPQVIMADEPTTSLDSITRDEIGKHLLGLKKNLSGGMIFVSHDLSVVKRLADRVLVLKEGRVVESGPMAEVFSHPLQAYTRRLVQAHRELGSRFLDIVRPLDAA